MTDAGLSISSHGHRTRLKWHRLRRSLADPLFSPDILDLGITAGASMELDLRLRADHGFVALHDAVVDDETTGHGAVRRLGRAELAAMVVKRGGHRPMLSEDIAPRLAGAHHDSLLQLDMKDDLATIGERGLDHLRHHFAAAGARIIVSARDLALIEAVRTRLPDARRGIDPTPVLLSLLQAKGAAAAEAHLRQAITGPTEADTVYLSWPLVLAAAGMGLDMISLAHDLGRKVDCWTFNPVHPDAGFSDAEARQFLALMALKPDQITTDEPFAIQSAWKALAG